MIFFFFFNDTATTEIYTLSLHDALPICDVSLSEARTLTPEQINFILGDSESDDAYDAPIPNIESVNTRDRKSTRLNSSHGYISYAVFCLKKKKAPLERNLQRTGHIPSHI